MLNVMPMLKPNLYKGQPLPLSQLTPDEFEDFVYVAMGELGSKKGFTLEAGRQKSTDGGFDCTARNTKTQGVICIQCKRYATALGTDTLADEVVKIALNGVLQGDTPEQHLIVTTGEVAKTTRVLLRQTDFIGLKKKCQEVLGKAYAAQRKGLEALNLDPVNVVHHYIDTAKIIVWSALDFDNELTLVWPSITPVLDKYFSVDVVVREYPRANFDIHRYRAGIRNTPCRYTELLLSQSQAPENILVENSAYRDDASLKFSYSDFINPSSNAFAAPGKTLIVCPGGGGKTALQHYIRFHLIEEGSDVVPVLIPLNTYSRGGLNKMIESSLGISWGSWQSLPSRFIFLFDGLDELQESEVNAFINELQAISVDYPCLITVRDTGLRIPVYIDGISAILRIEPLTYRQIVNIARLNLPVKMQSTFNDELRTLIQLPQAAFLRSPFGLTKALEFFQKHSALPKAFAGMLSTIVGDKITRSRSRVTSADTLLNKLDDFTIVRAMSAIVYEIRVGFGAYALAQDKLNELAQRVNQALSGEKLLFSFQSIGVFSDFITKFELLKKEKESFIFTEHNILLDYLLAMGLTKSWREVDSHTFKSIGRDACFFVGEQLSPADVPEFLNTILKQDAICGAEIAKARGGDGIATAEDWLLEQEQSVEILTRSAAIVALGVLGTGRAYARLRSSEGLCDHHHGGQRLAALACSGDVALLQHSYNDSSAMLQAVTKISGGEYQNWWRGPAAVITDIARERLATWKKDAQVFTCLASDTLGIYGDESDIPILEEVVAATESLKDMSSALYAIQKIDPVRLKGALYQALKQQKKYQFYIKKALFEMGEEVDFEDELNDLIGLVNDDRVFDRLNYSYLESTVNLLKLWPGMLVHEQRLLDAWEQGKQPADFIIYSYLWSIASAHQFALFAEAALDIVKHDDMDAMMYALSFFRSSPLDKLNLYFAEFAACYERNIVPGHNLSGVEAELIRLIEKCDDRELMFEWLNRFLATSFPAENQTKLSEDIFSYAMSLGMMIEMISRYASSLDEGIINKIILLNCQTFTEIDTHQRKMVDALSDDRATALLERAIASQSEQIINNFLAKLLDAKAHLLTKDLTIGLIPSLISHQTWHDTLLSLLALKWDDDVAEAFLHNIVTAHWHPTVAQLFESRAGEYAQLLRPDQLNNYLDAGDKIANPCIQRVFRLWIELARNERPSP